MHVPLSRVPPRPLAQMLLYAALVAWGASLFLPWFIIEAERAPVGGVHVMIGGILGGWMMNGWAAYANLFFAVVALRLHAGRAPGYAIGAMLLLAATLPFFKGVSSIFSSGTLVPVLSWGWGAFVWLVSLVLLTAAVLARNELPAGAAAEKHERLARREAARVGILILLAFAAALALHGYQWRRANEPDRQALLSEGMIFTVSELCPVALTWPAPLDGPKGEPVVLEIDPQLRRSKGVWLDLPGGLEDRHADGSAWRLHRVEGTTGNVMVRQKAQPGNLVMQFKADGEHAVLRLLKGVPRRVLYEQPLRAIALASGNTGFCPLAARPGFRDLDTYREALESAMALDPIGRFGAPLPRAEEAREPCDVGASDIDGINGLRHWDGREVIVSHASHGYTTGFCSASYMALMRGVSGENRTMEHRFIFVYDRKTFAPLAVFDSALSCPSTICGDDVSATVEAIRFDGRDAVVQTTLGAYSTKMRDKF